MQQIGNWQLRWLGHDGFQLATNQVTLYLDPYQVRSGRKADYILISHDHYDHFDRETVELLQGPKTVIIGPLSVVSQFGEQTIALKPNQRQQLPHLTIETVAAYNANKPFHPKDEEWLGYILELDGQRLYHAGDTDLIPEMGNLGHIDVAILPVSGTYTMDADEAIEAAKIIKPKIAIPMHYGGIIGDLRDAEHFAAGAREHTQVVLLQRETAQD